jgi:hypothetical protein
MTHDLFGKFTLTAPRAVESIPERLAGFDGFFELIITEAMVFRYMADIGA